jgi:class 3 adenylate cyclase/tetratricopeptide (TPR) repeat protein
MLFGDLVGFTALSASRDIEDVRELQSRYFQTCRTVIARYGGTVEKFIGDAVMAVWGVPSIHEDDAERAVRAGLELTASVAALGTEVGASDLAMRVGIVTGEVAVTEGATGEGLVTGDAVNTAARVQSQAAPGRVWVDDATRQHAGAAVVFTDAGMHSLKGKSGQFQLFEVRAVVASVGGTDRMDGLLAPLTGRERELRVIKELFHATVDDQQPRMLVVTGPPGVGKSRLGWEFEHYVDGLTVDVWWHRGRCPAYGDSVAFWALSEAFRDRFEIPTVADVATVDARLSSGLERYVVDGEQRRWIEPRLATLLGGSSGLPDLPRQDLFGAWSAFLGHLAARATAASSADRLSPVILLVEDAHHADDGFLDFLEQTVDHARFPLFVVLIARAELTGRRPGLGSGRRRSSIYVEPLPDSQMRALIDALVDGLPGSARDLLAGRSEGIPLFAVESVRSLIDRDAVVPQDGRYRATRDTEAALADVAAPATFEAIVAARLDALEADDRDLLKDAAVLGIEFTAEGLVALGRASTELDAGLTTLMRRDLIRPSRPDRRQQDSGFAFVQSIVRTVAYNSLSKKDRGTRHLAVAAHLEAQEDPSGELAPIIASHLVDAASNLPAPDAEAISARAVEVLLKAGLRALQVGSPSEALTLGRRALDMATERSIDDGSLLDLCAEASQRLGDLEAARAFDDAATESHERAGRTYAAARSAAHAGKMLIIAGRSGQAARHILPWYHIASRWGDRSSLPVHEHDDAESARLQILSDFTSALLTGRPPDARDDEEWPTFSFVAERCLVLAERRGDVRQQANALNMLAWNFHTQGARRVAMALWEHAATLTQSAGRPLNGVLVVANLASFTVEHDLSAARAWADKTLRLAEQVVDRPVLELAQGNLGTVLWLAGDWQELHALAQRAGPAEPGRPDALMFLARLATRMSGADVPPDEDSLESHTDDDGLDGDVRAWWIATREMRRRRPDPAVLEHAVKVYVDELGLTDVWHLWALAVGCALDEFQLGRARTLIDLVAAADAAVVSPLLMGLLHRFRGELILLEAGDLSLAEADLLEAVRRLDEFGARFYAACARTSLGQLLVDVGRPDEARLPLTEAVEVFGLLAATPWRERANALLRGDRSDALSGSQAGRRAPDATA